MAVQNVSGVASQLINTSTNIAIPVSTPAAVVNSPFTLSTWINANWGTSAAARGRHSFVGIYGPAAVASGLAAYYFNNKLLTAPASTVRNDAQINMNLASGAPSGTAITSDVFSIRWTGYLNVPTTGNYFFQTSSDDGIRVTVNGTMVINNWTDHSQTTNTATATVALTAGTPVPILVEYYNQGGQGVAILQYAVANILGAAGTYTTIPATAFTQSVPLTNTMTALQIGTSTGAGEISCWTYGGTTMVTTATNFNNAANNSWINVTYVFDGTQHNLYVNGALAATNIVDQQPGTLKYVTVNGYYAGGAGETDSHQVDAIWLYSRALSADEVLSLYNANGARHGNDLGLVAYYEFDEGIEGAAVTSIIDFSGGGNPLLMTGAGTAPKYTYVNCPVGSNIRPPTSQ